MNIKFQIIVRIDDETMFSETAYLTADSFLNFLSQLFVELKNRMMLKHAELEKKQAENN